MSVLFNENVKDSLVKGVQLMSKAVGTTFGPDGKNVIIKHQGGIHITKDGATVAQYVSDDDPVAQMAIDVVREVATKTAKDVGDGTTTSVILTDSIVQILKDSTENPISIQRGLQQDCKKVIEYLESNKKDINTFDDIKNQLNGKLESYKLPVHYEWIDEIPKTQNGKIQRGLLK